jgi:hypothetical protein
LPIALVRTWTEDAYDWEAQRVAFHSLMQVAEHDMLGDTSNWCNYYVWHGYQVARPDEVESFQDT